MKLHEIREQICELEKDAELDDMDEVNQSDNQTTMKAG